MKNHLFQIVSILLIFCSCQKIEIPENPLSKNDVSSKTFLHRPAGQIIASSYDNSGKVQITIWGNYVDGFHNHAEVSVDPGFVLIGGGARVSNFSNTNSGVKALLVSEYPKNDGTFTTFVADSKDHSVSYNHRLWVYAIGMKLYDANQNPIDANVIKSYLNLSTTISLSSENPIATTCPPTGYTSLSGGAKINYQNQGVLLTESWHPGLSGDSRCWEAKGKDHSVVSYATIESYNLSINPTIPQFGVLTISQKYGHSPTQPYTFGHTVLNSTDTYTGQNYLLG